MRSSACCPTWPATARCVGSTDGRRPPPIGHNVRVNLGIVVPLVVLAIALAGIFFWYRRTIADLRADRAKPVSGLRLTAEALHRAPSPPWRVVYEIGGALGDVDHVLVGPPGVTAITTLVGDRPRAEPSRDARTDAQLVGEAAIARGPLASCCGPSAARATGRPRSTGAPPTRNDPPPTSSFPAAS
jgi:hypothetical protein